jgi:hypothetical protein
MTIAMPDSVTVSNLPAGYSAYLGYADGEFANGAELHAKFPAADLVLLTVTGDTYGCEGCDIEPGNLTAEQGAVWAAGFINGAPAGSVPERPVLYASVEGEPGYGMEEVWQQLAYRGIGRPEVRLLSAHYGRGPHICGPDSCGAISIEMDGTQWTDSFATGGPNGAVIDMSMVVAGFFGWPSFSWETEMERLVGELGTVQQGMTGAVVKTVQGLCNAREAGGPVTSLVIDGVFGPVTTQMVKGLQQAGKIAVDGIVGPQTWPVLLGVA